MNQREAFEAWAIREGLNTRNTNGAYWFDTVRAYWGVWQAAQAAQPVGPVAYQYRTRADWVPDWGLWTECNKEQYENYLKVPKLHDWLYEVRALYTTPPAQLVASPVLWGFRYATGPVVDAVHKDRDTALREWLHLTPDAGSVVPLYTTPHNHLAAMQQALKALTWKSGGSDQAELERAAVKALRAIVGGA